jgi:hypothetical protein
MKIRIYKPKRFNRGPHRINPEIKPYTIKELSQTHELICEYEEKMIIPTAIDYIHSVDNGKFEEICPHMLKLPKGVIEMYTCDIIQVEYKDKSEYWMATLDAWHKIS